MVSQQVASLPASASARSVLADGYPSATLTPQAVLGVT